jgi:hypothetical protein
MATPESSITQQMEWYELPRWNDYLGAPDTVGFSLPTARTDRRGLLKFTSGPRSWAVEQESKFIRATFGSAWVEFQGYSERNKFWNGAGWKVEAIDRRGRITGTTEIRLPNPERAQQAYDRLRADLAKFESDRPAHCEYYPPPEAVPGDELGITGSGSSDPA